MQAPPPAWPPAGPLMQPPSPQGAPRRHSRFAALLLSFFSADLYRDVARSWRGIGLLYLLLLCFITWVPGLIRAHVALRAAANDPATAATLNQLPSVTVTNGVVSIKEPEPYVMRDPKTAKVLLYVDTSNRFQGPDAAQAEVLLGRSTMQVRQRGQTKIYDLSTLKYVYVDKTVARHWLDSFAKWFAFAALPFAMFGSLVWGLIRLVLYALIGLAFNSMFNARLDYAALMRLSAVAMTPGLVMDTVLGLLRVPVPCCGSMLVAGAITVGYLAFAVRANGQPVAPPGYGPTYAFPMAPPGTPFPPAPAPSPGYPQPPTVPPPATYPSPTAYPPPAPPPAPPQNW